MASALIDSARQADSDDTLSHYREHFFIPKDTIYLGGHSLGLMSDRAQERLFQVVRSWQQQAVESWWDQPQDDSTLAPWLELESRIAKLLVPFFGANALDLTVAAGLGINLVWVLHSLYRPNGAKKNIAMMSGMFPQDRWLAMNHLRLPGFDPNALSWLAPQGQRRHLDSTEIIEFLRREGARTAMLILEGVSYLSGQTFDLGAIAKEAQQQDVIFIVDVAHSAFVLPHAFNDWGVDAAIGCSYKFGCAGPGGIGLLYMNQKHWQDETVWRPGGWWGNDRSTQFLMGPSFHSAKGAAGWQVSTLAVLSAAPFLGTLELLHRAGIANLHAKSSALTGFFIDHLANTRAHGEHFDILTPSDSTQRAAEVSLEFHDSAKAKALHTWLRTKGAIIDYRESPFAPRQGKSTKPGIVRAGFNPLYNSYTDAAKLIELIELGC